MSHASPSPRLPHLALDPAQAGQLRTIAESIRAGCPPAAFAHACRHGAARLPADLRLPLQDFAADGSPTGVFLVSGLIIDDDLPPTPLTNTARVAADTTAGVQLSVLAEVLGHQVGYEGEGGTLVQDMVPAPHLAFTQQSQGSAVELEGHVEQAFSPLRPDFLLLGCLRADPAAATYYYPVADLMTEVTADEVALARQPLWTTLIDESFTDNLQDRTGQFRGPWPILSGSADHPNLLFDQDMQHGITAQATDLLHTIIRLYRTHRHQHVLEPGQALILDNTAVAHGRSPFPARFDGTDRFIARTFAVRDLHRFAPTFLPGTRIIGARHS